MSSYEFWLTEDTGKRIVLLKDLSFFSYSRAIKGHSTIEIGIPYRLFVQQVFPAFQPDRRVEIWRSPHTGIPMRLEGIYLLRMAKMYTRIEDNMDMIVFYGRGARDFLRRRCIIQAAGTSYTRKTLPIDDMMKEIVEEQMLYGSVVDADGVADNGRAFPQNEFFVQPAQGLGPTISASFADRNVLDTLKDLQEASFQLYGISIVNKKIYFDVVPVGAIGADSTILDENGVDAILDEAGANLLGEADEATFLDNTGFRFETYAGLYGSGVDRTTGMIFSVENNNIRAPYYSINHLNEANSCIVKGFGRGDSREWDVVDNDGVTSSRWNRAETFKDASNEPDQTLLGNFAYSTLNENKPEELLSVTFLNNPGNGDVPRSLYGVDWDLGDLLPVYYAGRQFNVEVAIVYVAINEKGKETITGRNEIDAYQT